MTMPCANGWTVKYDESLKQHYYHNETEDTVTFDLPCEVKRQSSDSTKMDQSTSSSSVSTASTTASSKNRLLSLLRRKSSSTLTCKKTKSNVLQKIGSAFQASHATSPKEESPVYPSLTSSATNSSLESIESYQSSLHFVSKRAGTTLLDDEYLINNVAQFKNFTGTSFVTGVAHQDSADEAYSIDSMESEEESIKSLREDNYAYANHKDSQNYNYNDYHYYYDEQVDLDKSVSDRDSEIRELRLQMLQELDL